MAEPDLIDGVDDIPWPHLSHAYGAAGDVPAVLRALTSASDEAGEAFESLCGSICHQGSVYSATPYAVPLLARIVAAGIRTVAVLGLLGWIAGSDDERGSKPSPLDALLVRRVQVGTIMADFVPNSGYKCSEKPVGTAGFEPATP